MTTDNINEALRIYNHRDWTWEMAESNFTRRCEKARAEMREYVALVNTIEDAEVRDALRRMWILKYNELHAAFSGKKFNDAAELETLEKRFAA